MRRGNELSLVSGDFRIWPLAAVDDYYQSGLISSMRIETSRYLLRDFSEADRQSFIDYNMDPRFRRLYDFEEFDVGCANELFDRFGYWREQTPRQNFQVGIIELSSSRLTGCAGLRQDSQPVGTAVLGLELAPDYWSRYGVAIEIANALIEYGFHTLNLKSIIGDTASGNSRVERLARWFGATIIDRRDGPEWVKNRGWQEIQWALTADAWGASSGRLRLLRTR